MQQEPGDWHELLGMIISNTQERQRIAQELGVRAITLSRWVRGESEPRPQNLRHLLSVLQPDHRDLLLEMLGEEIKESQDVTDDTSREIPSEFYSRVLSARATTNETLRYWSISSLILQQALGQLDPDRLGLAITVVRCMRSAGEKKVHSLRESVGKGTAPWTGDLEQRGMFLGAESLAGYVVTTCRPAQLQNIQKDGLTLPAHQVEHEVSAAAHPILYTGRIAGCVLISSTQPDYFVSSARNTLIGNYANLLALAIEPEEFYDPQDIELMIMPPHTLQKEYFANFRQRVTQALRQKTMNNLQAEQYVWEQLEEELLQVQLEGMKVSSTP
jgi:transcriptional regulator with XRE-family HTH domain